MLIKSNFTLKILSLAIILSCISLWGSNMQKNLTLNNKVFYGDIGIKGFKGDQKGVLTFKNGIFTSKHCELWGFKAEKYKSTIKGHKIFFEVSLKSKTNGILLWKGIVENKKIKANFIWVRKFLFWKIKKEYWFDGLETTKAK